MPAGAAAVLVDRHALLRNALMQNNKYSRCGAFPALRKPSPPGCRFHPRAAEFHYPCPPGGGRMATYWMWWVVAAALIAAELLSGTFYLLMIGIAVACAGVAAWIGWDLAYQWLTASVLGV